MALSIKPYIENKEKIHLIGIGGVSMNSLAGTGCARMLQPAWRRWARILPMNTRRKMWRVQR